MTILASSLLFVACGDDDGGGNGDGPAETTGTITATRTVIPGENQQPIVDESWTLPFVTATRFQNRINITSIDESTGESLTFLLPDNGQGVYQNNTDDPLAGTVAWVPGEGEISLSSIAPNDPGPESSMVVQITNIDTTAKVLSGNFTTVVKSPMNPANYAIFQEGAFIDVPYSNEIDGGADGFGEGTLTCDVDGEAFEQVTFLANAQPMIDKLNVTAVSADQISIGLTFPIDVESGTTFEFGAFTQEFAASYTYELTDFYSAIDGTMTVTTHNPDENFIEGTFSFDVGTTGGAVEAEIRNGVFEATYAE